MCLYKLWYASLLELPPWRKWFSCRPCGNITWQNDQDVDEKQATVVHYQLQLYQNILCKRLGDMIQKL